jgi:hypothetical protein
MRPTANRAAAWREAARIGPFPISLLLKVIILPVCYAAAHIPMKRRTVLRWLAAVFAARPLSSFRLFAQGRVEIDADRRATLVALAEIALPSTLDADGRALVVDRFARWVRDYRDGADMGHGYGFARLRARSGASPAGRYPEQFDALDAAARRLGASSFADLPADGRRTIVRAALDEPRRVTRLPSRPDGDNLVADFMGFYFSSMEAWDLAYERQIGRDRCRGLDGSEARPAPLGRG